MRSVSIHQVLSKIVRDLDLGNKEIPELDFIEWILFALRDIGSGGTFVDKKAAVDIIDFKGELPTDLIRLKSVTEFQTSKSKNQLAFQRALNLFIDLQEEIENMRNAIPNASPGSLPSLMERINQSEKKLEKMANDIRFLDPNSIRIEGEVGHRLIVEPMYAKKVLSYDSYNDGYNVQGNYINVSFQYGKINVVYLGLETDEDGYPTVPDDTDFQDAILWRIIYQLSMRGHVFLNQKLNDITFSLQMYNEHKRKARAIGNTLTTEELVLISDRWKRMFIGKNQSLNNIRYGTEVIRFNK